MPVLESREADLYAELDSAGYSNSEYGGWDSAEEGDYVYDPTLKKASEVRRELCQKD